MAYTCLDLMLCSSVIGAIIGIAVRWNHGWRESDLNDTPPLRNIVNNMIAWFIFLPVGLQLSSVFPNIPVAMGITSVLICIIRKYSVLNSLLSGGLFALVWIPIVHYFDFEQISC
jgi:hypothetical protein